MFELVPFARKSFGAPSDDFFKNFFGDFFERTGAITGSNFKVDIKESESEYTISAELPGVAKENINLELTEDGYLTIGVNREETIVDDGKSYVHRERRTASSSRTLYLADANSEGIKAKLENGILTLDIAKIDKTPKKTSISID